MVQAKPGQESSSSVELKLAADGSAFLLKSVLGRLAGSYPSPRASHGVRPARASSPDNFHQKTPKIFCISSHLNSPKGFQDSVSDVSLPENDLNEQQVRNTRL